MRDAPFMNIQNLALGPTQWTHQGWGMCSKGVEVISTKNLLFSNHFQILNASIPCHAPTNPKILSKFHNLGTSCNTLIWLGPAGSILGALKAIVNVIGMTKMTPPIKETDDDWGWMPCCGRNGRMRDVSRVCNLCKKYATHEQLKKQAVVATPFSFAKICGFICTSQWLGNYNDIQMLLAFNRSASIWGPVATAYANPEEQAWEGSGDAGDASMGWFTQACVEVVVIDVSVWRFAPSSQRGELHRPGWKDQVGRSWITFRGNNYSVQNHLLSTIIHNHNNQNVIEGLQPEYHTIAHTHTHMWIPGCNEFAWLQFLKNHNWQSHNVKADQTCQDHNH